MHAAAGRRIGERREGRGVTGSRGEEKKKSCYLFILNESKIVLHRASAEGQAERAKTGGSTAEKKTKKQSDGENTSGLIFNQYDEEREESLGGGVLR